MPVIEFLNAGKKVKCGQFANLRKVALMNDVPVYKGAHAIPLVPLLGNCAGNGLCGTCVMEIVQGGQNLTPPTRRERFWLRSKLPKYRLSCQCQVLGDVTCITAPALD